MTSTNISNDLDLNAQITAAWKENHRKLYFCAYSVVRNFPEPADAARDIVTDAFIKAVREPLHFSLQLHPQRSAQPYRAT